MDEADQPSHVDGPMEAEIRASLKKEEQEASKKGQAPLHATSGTAFLAAGLQLEDTQCIVCYLLYLADNKWQASY
jgi:hypothetical protein